MTEKTRIEIEAEQSLKQALALGRQMSAITDALFNGGKLPKADPFVDESKRGTIFHDHTCYRCRDGELPCPHKGKERNCDTLRARND